MKYSISKCAKTLELDVVLQRLSEQAQITQTKEMAHSLVPLTKLADVDHKLNETYQAYLLIGRFSAPSFISAKNVASSLERAKVGAVLSAKELLFVADTLRTVRGVKKWYGDCERASADLLDDYFSELLPNKFLEDKITFAIKSEDEISDSASGTLSDIRRKISAKNADIRSSLEKIIHGQYSKYLQECIITQRDGRFVVPVKSEHKAQIKGIVHDTSSSGSTIFIEPISVVEANNDIRLLKAKEAEEIERILAELSSDCADFAETIINSFKILVKLDLIFAKAKLAYKMAAVLPKTNDNGYINLIKARHPLIAPDKVVPIDISLGKDYDSLIITGPNTGGKTVSLKTLGLHVLMAMCGLMIPAADNSEISVFDKVFADIGDEQSIEQSLSTFSSHMVNIVSILEQCNDNSLALFDELCAGTDPVEGAALAKSILKTLSAIGAKIVATTHYPELKVFAIDNERTQNASCEFNINTLKPTYRLITGIPGRSNAFLISEKLGLSKDIIALAEKEIDEDDVKFERVVVSLEKARADAENEQRRLQQFKKQIELQKAEAERLNNDIKIKQEKLLDSAKKQANDIIEKTRYKADTLLNELEEIKKSFNKDNASSNLERARREFSGVIKDLDDIADPIVKNGVNTGGNVTELKEGDSVLLTDFNQDATVLSVNSDEKKAFVISGSIKMWVSFEDLQLKKKSLKTTPAKKHRTVSGIPSKADSTIQSEIDIRGLASDEAIFALDKYIDQVYLSGVNTVRIIHGKGTGVLRKAVQSYLRKHKCVRTYRIGVFGEGEDGVTIAELKN